MCDLKQEKEHPQQTLENHLIYKLEDVFEVKSMTVEKYRIIEQLILNYGLNKIIHYLNQK